MLEQQGQSNKQSQHPSILNMSPTQRIMNCHHPTAPMLNTIQYPHSLTNVCCCLTFEGTASGTFYIDTPGVFPVTLLESMQAYFVTYDYDTNSNFDKPAYLNYETNIIVSEEGFNKLKDKGCIRTLNVTDNHATKQIKAFPKKEMCRWQFLEPSNQQVKCK